MTPELAAENAAKVLEQAREHFLDGRLVDALVAVADGWTRLHTALANAPKTIEPTWVSMPGKPTPVLGGAPALTLAFDPADPPIVRAGGADHEVVGYNVRVGPEGVGYIELQVVKLDRRR